MKTCKNCKINRVLTDFYINNKKTETRKLTCRFCEQANKKAKLLQNPEYYNEINNTRKKKWGRMYPDKVRNTYLKKRYGITTEMYNSLLNAQNGVCAICGLVETKINKDTGDVKNLAVDHDHSSNKIRGLLCFHCNSSLGKFKDSIQLLQNAINYLKKSRE